LIQKVILYFGSIIFVILLFIITGMLQMKIEFWGEPLGRGALLIIVFCIICSPIFLITNLVQFVLFRYTKQSIWLISIPLLLFSLLYVVLVELGLIENFIFLAGLFSQIVISTMLCIYHNNFRLKSKFNK